MAINPLVLDLFAGAFGLVVGSFLNVLSLRTLKGESIVWPPSHCPSCKRTIPPWDNIPVVSFIVLGGRCRFCRNRISWQYIAVEIATALSFVLLVRSFGISWQTLGMLVFVSTLIAVTVTDLREKLIPHDITYPAMLAGIGFSAFVRRDLLGAMAGIGASYIIFDFLAHYGLKIYSAVHGKQADQVESNQAADDALDESLGLGPSPAAAEEVEVMGGGDAVLSAVIASFLGWQRLVAALLIGFLVGTLIGTILLIIEMRKAKLLGETLRPAAAGAIIGFSFLGLSSLLLELSLGVGNIPWLEFGLVGAAGGGLLGIVSVGTRVSKPFPFGPALAIGAIVAIFWDPVGSLFGGGA